ncbi:MAG: hypothetical protein CVU05_14220 [Bacteroidetes bacterium HGW-Bacteroidetes-21]|jgi:hypothetical protein|nr:MAG: hypothetical protein CVU05_14220 [Bacteroidetes bacterium HGW-Bacteroidetes-21]
MKAIALIPVMIFFYIFSLTAQNISSFEKSILPIGNKGKKFSKEFYQWVESQSMIDILSSNKIDTVLANGKFVYQNPIPYPGSATISRMYTSQSNGYIVYKILFVCKDDHYSIKLYDFEHQSNSKTDKITFGKISNTENPPKYIMQDYDPEWGLQVWKNLKDQCLLVSTDFFSQLQTELAKLK